MSYESLPIALEVTGCGELLSEGTSRHIESIGLLRNGGAKVIYRFPNGRGASVVRHPLSYGAPAGTFELAVLSPDGLVDETTPVTDDVCKDLTPRMVERTLVQIMRLPAAVAA